MEPLIDLRVTEGKKFFYGFRPYPETWHWYPINFWLYTDDDEIRYKRKLFAAKDWMKRNEL